MIQRRYFDQAYYDGLSDEDKETFYKCIKTGFDNADSGMGCYAMTPKDYTTFAPFFAKAIGDYHKAVSKAFCCAARAALTKGRWAPVAKLVRAWAERDLATSATCLSVFDEDEPLPLYVTDELKTLFCAAWVAEPRLIAEMIGSDRPPNDIMTNFGLLLRAAEPELNDDALGRVFACMEHVDALWHLHGIRYSAAALIVQWQPSFYAIRNESPFLESYGWLSRLFRAGDRCGDGARVGNIIAGLLPYLVGWEEADEIETAATARRMTTGWADEGKRAAFVAAWASSEQQRSDY